MRAFSKPYYMCIVIPIFKISSSGWLLTSEQIVELNNLMPKKHAFVNLKLFTLDIALTYFFRMYKVLSGQASGWLKAVRTVPADGLSISEAHSIILEIICHFSETVVKL